MKAANRYGGPWLDAVLIYTESNKNPIKARLRSIPGVERVEPEGAFLLWYDCHKLKIESSVLTAFLKDKAKRSIMHSEAFGNEGISFARLNMASPRARLEGALDQMEKALRRL